MPRHQGQKHSNSQDNMSALDPCNPTTVGPEKCNTAELQNKDFKIAVMSMFKDLKEALNE